MLENFWLLTTVLLSVILLWKIVPKARKKKLRLFQGEEYALDIIINTDLKMQRGKAISQACHAVSGILSSLRGNEKILELWKSCGEPKIVLKASMCNILDVVSNAKANGIMIYKVYDAGRTQVLSGSNTAVAIGPAPKSMLTLLTGHLSLY